MIENENKTTLYLSASIAAALAAGRMAHLSLKRISVIALLILNSQIVLGVLYSFFGYTASYFVPILPAAILLVAAVTVIWCVIQWVNLLTAERELREVLSHLIKDASELSGDLVPFDRPPSDKPNEKIEGRVRVIQRFLELLSSAERL
jgi:hypothetical protein